MFSRLQSCRPLLHAKCLSSVDGCPLCRTEIDGMYIRVLITLHYLIIGICAENIYVLNKLWKVRTIGNIIKKITYEYKNQLRVGITGELDKSRCKPFFNPTSIYLIDNKNTASIAKNVSLINENFPTLKNFQFQM